MYSINSNIENTIEIKKSKFITKLYKINDLNEINIVLEQLNKEYKDANHICFAYILEGIERCSDNGEPSGTAGMPILNVLKKNNLSYVLCVVIRYFGGIKLGAGGLARAYSNSAIEALKLTTIIKYNDGYLIEIKFNYNNKKLVENILNNYNVIDKKYSEEITYTLEINNEELDKIKNDLTNLDICINIIKRILIKS